MTQCTLIREAAWQVRQDGFAIQAAAEACAQYLAAVSASFDFAKDEANCFFTPGGDPVQMAMTLTEKATGKTRTVITKVDEEGTWFWFVLNMSGCRHEASELIACVQARIGCRLTAHFTGKAEVTGKAVN